MWTTARVTRWTWVVAIAMWAGALLNPLLASGSKTVTGGPLGGDLRVFWSAGQLILDGRATDIWDPHLIAAQAPEHFTDGLLSYPYPPHLAMAETPLALLPFRAAYLLHAALLALLLVLAIRHLARVNPIVARHRAGATAAALTLVPSFYGAVGGQATYLLVFLVTVGAVLTVQGRDEAGAGLFTLLAYKPQFLAVPGTWLAARRRPRVIAIGVAAGVVWYLAAVPLFGWAWPADWLETGVGTWNAYQGDANRGAALSLPSVVRTAPSSWQALLVVPVAAAAAGLVMSTTRRWPALDPAHRVGAIAALTALLSPSALYYELGLALPALAAYADRRGRAALPTFVAYWTLSWLAIINTGPVNAAFPLAVWAWWLCVQPRAATPVAA